MNDGKPVALVTGAGTGIGRSAALALARDGYDLVVNFSRSEEAAKCTVRDAEAAGARTLLFRCDVSDDACVRSMLDATKKNFERLDLLINNAGTTIDVGPKDFDGVKVEDWNRVFAVNVLGLFLVTRAATPLLRESPNGCIVNTCSIAGLRPGQQPLPYAASVVPALLIRWINDPSIKRFDLSSVEVIQSGGQRLQPEVRRRTKELIPSVTVQENFGMAEGMLMFVRLDDPEEVRMETVGRPISPDDEVRLVDDDDNEVVPGEVGEFLARGPYTLRGYYGAPEHNARAFTSDGFYRTGDLMRQHPSGNYLVEGRKKDLINRGGEKISAEEIENLVLTHPAVQNVACIPMPDPVLGERMCACVILRSGRALSFEELVAFLTKQEIAKHKLPERVEIMNEFPMSAFGKVSKKDLIERIALKLKAEGKI